jgi:hypothetical protein
MEHFSEKILWQTGDGMEWETDRELDILYSFVDSLNNPDKFEIHCLHCIIEELSEAVKRLTALNPSSSAL